MKKTRRKRFLSCRTFMRVSMRELYILHVYVMYARTVIRTHVYTHMPHATRYIQNVPNTRHFGYVKIKTKKKTESPKTIK